MVTIQGVNGLPEPKPDRPEKVRSDRGAAPSNGPSGPEGAARDDVSISSEAQAAAEVIRVIQMTASQGDIRADKVAAAKERIEQGHYKNPDVVAQVADRIMKLID